MPKYCKDCIRLEIVIKELDKELNEKREIIKDCIDLLKQQQFIYQEMKDIIHSDDD